MYEEQLKQDFGTRLHFYDCIDSTNTEAKRKALEEAAHGTLIVADMQNSGKGRLGRSWSSASGMGIWMSLLLRPAFSTHLAPKLTILAAMAVSDVLHDMQIPCSIKWPNDIVMNGKKVCGILTEMGMDQDRISYVIVGIGINVYNESFPDEIKDVATSIRKECPNIFVDRATLVSRIIKRFEAYYNTFTIEENLSFVCETYNQRLVHRNKDVFIMEGNKRRQGICLGMDDQGALVIEFDGIKESIIAGEVSVRGIYGYA